MAAKQALVFGGSGISGWAIARTCLSYPSNSTFSQVIALTNRPVDKDSYLLPESEAERLSVYSGIDLTASVEEVIEKLKAIRNLEATTHIYYSAYTAHGSNFQALKAANVSLLTTTLKAISPLCPALEFFVLQTGGKTYGVEFYGQPGVPYALPLSESSARLPEPYASNIFYYAQLDALQSLQEGQKWKWCEVRPDVIVGHTPHPNGMGFAQAVGIWLSMYKSMYGSGSEVIFPGNDLVWRAKRSDTSQDVLARFSVHASLHPEETAGKAFNIADEEITTWESIWPKICDYFGLVGVGPKPDVEGELRGTAWVLAQSANWEKWAKENGLKEGVIGASSWEMMGLAFGFLMFDKQYDLSAAKKTGFVEDTPTIKGYYLAFDRMKQANIIPK